MSILWIERISIFLHWLIMERSSNWPDLRSLIFKNPIYTSCRYVATSSVIQYQKFESIRLKIVGLVRVKTFWEVRPQDSIWWPDLSWPRVNIFTKVAKRWWLRYVMIRRRYASTFSAILRKPERGVWTPPPPPPRVRRGINKTVPWFKKIAPRALKYHHQGLAWMRPGTAICLCRNSFSEYF